MMMQQFIELHLSIILTPSEVTSRRWPTACALTGRKSAHIQSRLGYCRQTANQTAEPRRSEQLRVQTGNAKEDFCKWLACSGPAPTGGSGDMRSECGKKRVTL